jgi:hypothetical protein
MNNTNIIFIILKCLIIILSFVSIIFGSIKLNSNCTNIKILPIYLICNGIIHILCAFLSNNFEINSKINNYIIYLFSIIYIGILIWGFIILVDLDYIPHYIPDCDKFLFHYAFAIIIVPYCVLLLISLFICFSYLCSKNKKNTREIEYYNNLIMIYV